MPKPMHLFESKTRAERMADRLQHEAVRAAHLAGMAKRLHGIAKNLDVHLRAHVIKLEQMSSDYMAESVGAPAKKTAEVADRIWPELESIIRPADDETYHAGIVIAETIAKFLARL